MTTKNLLNARRMIVLSGLALLAVAASAAALPLGLSHSVATPAGSVDASYDDYAANACISPATPALPALPAVPAVPLPLPIGVPALPAAPTIAGAGTVCADASENGVHASAVADAMGAHAETGADVDTSEQAKAVKGAANDGKGFLESLASKIASWF
jgi:hypothetical protein